MDQEERCEEEQDKEFENIMFILDNGEEIKINEQWHICITNYFYIKTICYSFFVSGKNLNCL